MLQTCTVLVLRLAEHELNVPQANNVGWVATSALDLMLDFKQWVWIRFVNLNFQTGISYKPIVSRMQPICQELLTAYLLHDCTPTKNHSGVPSSIILWTSHCVINDEFYIASHYHKIRENCLSYKSNLSYKSESTAHQGSYDSPVQLQW